MDVPGPMRRRGPRPLALHLVLAAGMRPDAPTGLPDADLSLGGIDPAFIAGVAAYRRHPYRRTLRDPPAIWSDGNARLLDYGVGSDAPAVLFVPSLVNRAYVLDLAPGRSMMRWLVAQGMRPLLMDWGWPGPEERRFTLTDHVAGRLAAAVAAVGRPVVLAGYCMGGLLALALAQLRPAVVRALVLLATPWDFHAPCPGPALRLRAGLPWLDPALTATGTLPVDMLQTVFALLDPGATTARFRAFASLPADSDRARGFVAVEDWANDGVPLAAPVARECIDGWYGANSTADDSWRVAGQRIDPSLLRLPCFVAVPDQDRIVPAASAHALAARLADVTVHASGAGHVGMVAGGRAEAELWQPLLGWLRRLPPPI